MVTFPEAFSLTDYFLLDRLREGRGDHPAIRYGDRAWTYAEVADRSLRLARHLRAAGLRPGDRVYVVLPDCPPFAWSIFGTLAAGGVLCMGNPDAVPKDLAATLSYVGAAALITTPRVAAALRDLVPLPPTLLVPDTATGDDPERPATPDLAPDLAPAPNFAVDDLAAAIAAAPADTVPAAQLPALHRDDLCIWLFTSGSTGASKAAMHTQRDFAFNTEVYAKRTVGYRPDDRTVSVPRLFFGYATGTNLFFPFAVGATACLFSERPTPASLADAIRRYRPTVVTNVPTMIGKLLDHDEELRAQGLPGLDLSGLRFQLSAGEALPPALLERAMRRFGGEIYDGIGSAEMFHIYASNRPGDVRPGSLGRAVEGYELRVLAEEAEGPGAPTLPPGEIGVLWVRGDSVALGYHRDRDKSWRTFHGRWCRTGDLFSIDADGYLYFSGRSDDLIKVGGQWVAPIEVENALMAHPDVLLAAVIGAPDSDGLQKPKAFVVLRAERRHDDPALIAPLLQEFVRSRLLKHKYPRWIEIRDDLPRNDRGKVDKKLLRA